MAAPCQRIISLVEGANAVDLIDRALLQMVLQIAPDALPVEDDLDPERRQPVRRSDAGAMQHLNRSDRASAQDHFAAGASLDNLATLAEAHPDGAPLLDNQAIGQHVRLKTQIGTVQGGLQETPCRRPAASALLVDVEIADAFIVAGIEIRNFPDSHFFRRFADRVEHCPGQPRCLDPPAAADAVKRALAQKMILKPPECRQHVIPAPAAKSKLAPVVVIGGLSAHRDHCVDGGGTADHLAAGIGQRAAVEAGFGLGPEHPVRTRVADREQVTDRDVEPDPVVVAAGLQDQHAVGRIGREPVGDDTAGGARADDDVVKITFKPLRHLNFRPGCDRLSCPTLCRASTSLFDRYLVRRGRPAHLARRRADPMALLPGRDGLCQSLDSVGPSVAAC